MLGFCISIVLVVLGGLIEDLIKYLIRYLKYFSKQVEFVLMFFL